MVVKPDGNVRSLNLYLLMVFSLPKTSANIVGNEVSRKLERLSSHLQRCVKYRSTLNNVDKNDTNNQNLLLPSSSIVQQSKTNQISQNEHVISTTPAKKVQIDYKVAKFFYANAI